MYVFTPIFHLFNIISFAFSKQLTLCSWYTQPSFSHTFLTIILQIMFPPQALSSAYSTGPFPQTEAEDGRATNKTLFFIDPFSAKDPPPSRVHAERSCHEFSHDVFRNLHLAAEGLLTSDRRISSNLCCVFSSSFHACLGQAYPLFEICSNR